MFVLLSIRGGLRLEKDSGEGRGVVVVKGQFRANALFSWAVPKFEREAAPGTGKQLHQKDACGAHMNPGF